MKLDKKFSEVLKEYSRLINKIEEDSFLRDKCYDESLPIAAAELWIKAKKRNDLEDLDYKTIERIKLGWSEKFPNVFNEEPDIYTSNLAIYYVALLEIKNGYQQFELQKELTDIRDYIFNHMIRKGVLISSTKKGRPDFDLVFSVLPFGLFAPEDLVMVSAMEELSSTNHELTQNEKALLGIYYTEKYDFVKADNFLTQAKTLMKEDYVLIDLLITYLSQKKSNISSSRFIHKPLGNGNIYDKLPYERKPHYPSFGEECQFNVQVNIDSIKEVLLVIEGITDPIPCTIIDDKLSIYQAKFTVPVDYRGGNYYFVVTGNKIEESECYQLAIQKVSTLDKIELIGAGNLGNTYRIKNGQKNLFLTLQETKMVITQNQPTIHTATPNSQFALIDENRCIQFSNGQKAIKFMNNFLEVHELLGFGITGITMKISDEAQAYYGFGERYNAVNQLGNVLDCFVYNQYRDQGTRTYMPMPYYFTDNSYGLFVSTNYYTRFDLKSKKEDEISIFIETGCEDKLIEIDLYQGSMKEMIAQYISSTGEPVMVPSWALGPWMSSNNWDRDSIVRNQVELTQTYNIPATVIVLEQWSDETTYYMFNDAQYPMINPGEYHTYDQMSFPEWGRWPDPKGLIEYCHENGMKFILWQIPIEKYLNQQEHPLKDQDEAYMIEKGYIVKNSDGSPYRIPENWFTDSLLMDFTNEEAKKWWFNKRQYLIDIGVDGFKTDGGEMVYGSDVLFADGSSGRDMRNRYPKEYIKSYYDFAKQNNGITFSRSGYTGAQSYPAHWAGDERSTFDAFKRQLIAGINSGLSGVIFWGWDLAGFNGDIPSAELFMRSSSMAAFCPIMQYHAESKGEFNQDRTPWNIAERSSTPKVIDVYRFFANTRMSLMPYIFDQAVKSVTEKAPLMRAMQIEFSQEKFENCYDQFMFGESLLVAPIIAEGANTREVILPQGDWMDFWTHEVILGGQAITVDANIDQIPVFIRENSAILLNLGSSKRLGETIGNDLTRYTNATLIVFAKTNFTQLIQDHLGNKIQIEVDVIDGKVKVNHDLPIKIELVVL